MRTIIIIIINFAVGVALLPADARAQEATPAATPDATPEPTPAATAAPGTSPSTALATAEPGSGRRIPIGSYGELHYNAVNGRSAGNEVDLHRFILFVGHRFDDKVAFYSELEIEHGGEEVALEQAYLEYVENRFFGARAGLVLVPMGILNALHEPPTFHGVERTSVDRIIVPTTWREAGAGIFGEPIDGLKYQLLVVNGLDASGFTASGGIRGGRGGAVQTAFNDVAVVGRIEYSPALGIDLGVTGYGGGAGQDQPGISHVAVTIGEVDARLAWNGIGARAQYARGRIDDVESLNAYLAANNPGAGELGGAMEGFYAEASYDVLTLLRASRPSLTWEVHPFARYERTNTQLDMPDGSAADASQNRSIVTAGVSVKPNPRVVLKADYQWTDAEAGNPPNLWNLGIGYMF